MAKYRLQRYEVSTDNGQTWTAVLPEQFRKGQLLDNNVGCEVAEWRIVEGYICDEAGTSTVTVISSGVINTGGCTTNSMTDIARLSYSTVDAWEIGSKSNNVYHTSYESTSDYDPCEQYQWVDTGTTICYDGNKYKTEKQQHLENGTWVDTGVQRHSTLIGADSSCNVSRWIERGKTTVVNGIQYYIKEEELSTDGGNSFKLTGNTQTTDVVANMLSGNAITYAFKPIYNYDDDGGMIVSYDNGNTWEQYYLNPSIGRIVYLDYAVGESMLGTWTRDDAITDLIDWDSSHSITLPHSAGNTQFAVNWHGTTYNSKQTLWSSLGCNDVNLYHNAGMIFYPTSASGKEYPYIGFMRENGTDYSTYSYYFRGSCIPNSDKYCYDPSTDIGRNAFGPKLVGNVVQCTYLNASSVSLTWNEFILLYSKTNHYLGLNRYADGDGIFYVLYDFNDLKYTVFRTSIEEENPVETRWIDDGGYIVDGNVVYHREKEQINYNETGWTDTGNRRKGSAIGPVENETLAVCAGPKGNLAVTLQKITIDETTTNVNLCLLPTESQVTTDYYPVVVNQGMTGSDTVEASSVLNTNVPVSARYYLKPSGAFDSATSGDYLRYAYTTGITIILAKPRVVSYGYMLFYANTYNIEYVHPAYRINRFVGAYRTARMDYISFNEWGYDADTAAMTSDDIINLFDDTTSSHNKKYPAKLDLTGAHADFKAKVRTISGITSEIIDND